MKPKGLTGRLSAAIRDRRFDAALPFIVPGSRVLDVGCWMGGIIPRLPAGVEYTGVEALPYLHAECLRRFPSHRFLLGDFEALAPSLGAEFDAVLLLAVLEHIPAPGPFLAACAGRLKPTGLLVATTPSRAAEPLVWLGSKVGLLSSWNPGEHQALLDRRRMETLAGGAGLELFRSERFLAGLNQLFVLRKMA